MSLWLDYSFPLIVIEGYNLPPGSPKHSPEALTARPGAWRFHATRAWLGLSKDESREAEAPVEYEWVAAASYAPAQIQLVLTELNHCPHWRQILWWHTTRATTSKSTWTTYQIETRPCTAMPQSKPTYHPDWSDGDYLWMSYWTAPQEAWPRPV